MRTFIDSLKARKAAASEGGFSLIDVVVTVAIIVALSVGGFIAYTGLVTSAKEAATAAAADQVYTAVIVANNDGGKDTPAQIATKYNASSNGIKVFTDGSKVYAVHEGAKTQPADFAAAVTADAPGNEDLIVVRG